jgi:hypothetical protein
MFKSCLRVREIEKYINIRICNIFWLFQILRVAKYDKYFQDMLAETDVGHPDHDDVARQAEKCKHVRTLNYK